MVLPVTVRVRPGEGRGGKRRKDYLLLSLLGARPVALGMHYILRIYTITCDLNESAVIYGFCEGPAW